MQKLLTIVVPVYKVEQYINKCLDSCIIYKADGSLDEEKMNQLEIIIVNDGTPDNSAELSRVYTKRYPKTFRQIDKKNGGHGSAWNIGLKEATGKYLRFLDSDDWLTNLDKLMEKLQDCEADLVFTQLDKIMVEKNEVVRWPVLGLYDILQKIESFSFDTQHDETICDFQYCTYKTELLKPLHPLFDEHLFYDDMILFVVPQLRAQTYIIYDFVLYNYLIGRIGQTMNPQILSRNKKYLLKEFFKMLQYYLSNFKNNKGSSWAHYAISKYYIGHLWDLLSAPDNFQEAKKIKDEIQKHHLDEIYKPSKQIVRYKKLPFFLFYAIEKIRTIKNR